MIIVSILKDKSYSDVYLGPWQTSGMIFFQNQLTNKSR